MPEEKTEVEQTKRVVDNVVDLKDIMKKSFGTYAAYVIGHRAIPDIRDGLKPVQRRLLYTAYELGARHDKKHMKSAEVSGTCMGRYHPHGDAYLTMVRMTQDFIMRHPLFEGQGNFGTLDDSAGAQRYTEIRLARFGEDLFFSDLNPDSVKWKSNYAENRQEPTVLPAELPQLLMNGTDGIAVGMATEILSYCGKELIDCLILELDNKTLSTSDTVPDCFKGPDFPTGGLMEADPEQTRSVWTDGKGRFKLRGTASFEVNEHGERRLIINALPYYVSQANLVILTSQLTSIKNDDGLYDIPGVDRISDTTTQDGVRIVFDLDKRADPQVILNLLYQKTDLQKSLSSNMTVLDNDRPCRVGVKKALLRWLDFRREVMRNNLNRESRILLERKELVDAFIKVHEDIDKVIKIIRKSDNSIEALKKELLLNDRQAEAVVKLPLGRLRKLDEEGLKNENAQIVVRVSEIKTTLESADGVDKLIKARLLYWKDKLDDRRTKVVRKFDDIGLHDTIVKEDVVLAINQRGEAKITRLSDYRQTGRRSAGVKETKDEENSDDAAPKFAIKVTTHDMILLFTDKGKCHELPGVQLPITARRGRPVPLKSLFVDLQDDEQAVAVLALDTEKTFPPEDSIVLLATDGGIKRLSVDTLMRHRGTSCVCMPTDEKTKLIGAEYIKANDYIAVFMARGLIRCFSAESVRQTKSRSCGTVKTKPAEEGDRFIRVEALSPNSKSDVLVVTSDGFALRIPVDAIPVKKGRCTGGNKLIRLDRSDCEVVYAGSVQDGDLVFLTTSALKSAVFDVTEVREIAARGGKGVRVGRLEGTEKVVTAAVVRPMERT